MFSLDDSPDDEIETADGAEMSDGPLAASEAENESEAVATDKLASFSLEIEGAAIIGPDDRGSGSNTDCAAGTDCDSSFDALYFIK